MTYRITGIDPAPYRRLAGLSEDDLAAEGVIRMTVSEMPGFPCRASLADQAVGERVLLLNHVSHDVSGPYRASHAIFIAENAEVAAQFVDEIPPALQRRPLSLRGFAADGMMVDAMLVEPGGADDGVRRLLENSDIAVIHAHNAVRGCFAAEIRRN